MATTILDTPARSARSPLVHDSPLDLDLSSSETVNNNHHEIDRSTSSTESQHTSREISSQCPDQLSRILGSHETIGTCPTYFSKHNEHEHHSDSNYPAYKIKPDTYDGSYAFERYISHFNDCAELGLWDDRIKVLMLASNLRGTARDFYDSLSKRDRRNFETLSERLTYRFGISGKHRSVWLHKLETRRRNPSESIISFAEDIRQLCQKAYSDFDSHSQERLALDQLYRNVTPEMQCRCIDHNCTSVSQAVNVIERCESILGTQHPDLRAPESTANSRSDFEDFMQHIINRLNKMELTIQQSRFQLEEAARCSSCYSSIPSLASCPRKSLSRSRQTFQQKRHLIQTCTYKVQICRE